MDEPQYVPLTDSDIRRILNENVKIIKYSELDKYNNILSLLPNPFDYVIILVERTLDNGHWVLLLRLKNKLFFFDPYGERPDKMLKYSSKQTRRILNMEYPHLTRLLNNSLDQFKVYFSSFPYQKSDKEIQTCGRHLISVIKYFKQFQKHNPSLKSYKKYMDNLKKQLNLYDYDAVVSHLYK
jgi:hypothetical protein